MKRVTRFSLLGTVLMLGACGPIESIHPLFTKDDLIFDPALIGAWVEKGDDGNTLTFQPSGDGAYQVIEVEVDHNTRSRQETSFDAHLVRLGDYLFLDAVPRGRRASPASYKLRLVRSKCENRFEPHLFAVGDGLYVDLAPDEHAREGIAYQLRLLSAHWFFRVSTQGDNLRLAALDEEGVKELIDGGLLEIPHQFTDEDRKGIVLTAPTEDLQRFVVEHAEDEKAFGTPGEWRRGP